MRPIKDNIIVEPIKEVQLTSGLFVPQGFNEKNLATVISVGEGRRGRPMLVEPGQTIQYRANSGRELSYDGKEYLLIRQSHVIGIV